MQKCRVLCGGELRPQRVELRLRHARVEKIRFGAGGKIGVLNVRLGARVHSSTAASRRLMSFFMGVAPF